MSHSQTVVPMIALVAAYATSGCGTQAVADEEPAVNPELTENLALCGNRTPVAPFRDEALPWFAAHRELATPELIHLVERGGGSAERAAIALGHIGAAEAVPALDSALTNGVITHQNAAARALWAIGNPDATAALSRAIQAAGSPAKRALQALTPMDGRSPCDLIALADSEPGLAESVAAARERCGC